MKTILLEIISTGPCNFREIIAEGRSLIEEQLDDIVVRTGQVKDTLDELDQEGLVGWTGSCRNKAVISQLGREVLASSCISSS